jgi:hypothetical protein
VRVGVGAGVAWSYPHQLSILNGADGSGW